jgi:hypothetical protein
LPPGNYTAVVSALSGTGIALLEVSDLRNLGGTVVPATSPTNLVVQGGAGPAPGKPHSLSAAAAKATLEFCAAVPLAVTIASR